MQKRGQARLRNDRLMRQWGGASGSGRLNFRWPVVARDCSTTSPTAGASEVLAPDSRTLLLDALRPPLRPARWIAPSQRRSPSI